MIDLRKKFSDKQEKTRQDRAERQAELRRIEALQDLGADEDDKLQSIVKELIEHRKKRNGSAS